MNNIWNLFRSTSDYMAKYSLQGKYYFPKE
jgi:hypothetical protein